ncbi:Sulfate transport system permease protein CysW [Sporotomaculum syntrophicum]|uniref:Sulfate transport system permease protein CysW n=1 Tax=Sporotomaculum syntrophicum TaxID=182264 RepID=A0A9D2WMB9_9FIRM|nr:ABC transporter permease [Sporotomaculum syntrophicum]KAF1084107.1 Sulfate transport system permease protein CysW [Sporotomaculum syntrophicum]
MEMIWEGLTKALQMLLSGDPVVLQITWFTLRVSGTATLISLLIGIPLGLFLAFKVFPGRSVVVSFVNMGMGLPPVVVGLWVSLFLWRSGPLGFLDLIYTPTAIIIAQAVIASPIVTGFSMAAIAQLNPKIRLQILALGASRWQLYWLLIKETRLGLLAAVIAGFGGVVSEVGAAMMVGGNILGQTRTLTTATVMEVNKGNFDIGIALSVILLTLAYLVTFILTVLQQRGRY